MRLFDRPLAHEDWQLLAGLACILATGLLPDIAGSGYWSYSFQYVNVLIVVAVAQNFLLHDASQVSFGQGAIFGAGAYAAAMAMSMHGLPWIIAAILAVGGAAIGGLIYAIPALRVQGYYLGFVTLSAAMVFPELLFSLDHYTNGVNGISIATTAWKEPLLLGLTPLSLATTTLACLAILAHLMVRRSALGRKVLVAGASPEAAQTLGIRPGVVRAGAFIASAALTGAAGALYPPIVGFVSPAAFHLELSILLFLAVIVGGRGQIFGPLAGIYLLHLLPNVLLAEIADYRLLAYGVIALLVMLVMPDGIVGSLTRRLRRRSELAAPELAVSALRFPPATPRGGNAAPDIAVRGASKSFGAVRAIDCVDLEVAPSRIVGLVGANGSGKTSLINAITGFSRLNAGSIVIKGVPIAGRSPAAVARLGAARTFQTPRIFDSLSVWENIAIGGEAAGRKDTMDGEGWIQARERLARASTDTVPHGQRRTIEVLRAVLTGAGIILLDEPAAGLSQEERGQLVALLRRLRDEAGRTIVLVEHDLALVWNVADEIVVMEGGRIAAAGKPAEIRSNPAVAKLFVGTHA